MRDQFLVEVTDISRDQLAGRGSSEVAALLALNGQLTARVESVYHHQVHSETGQTPLDRWNDGWQRVTGTPAILDGAALTEAFLWAQLRTVTKTATVSLHGNMYQVQASTASTTKPSRCGHRSNDQDLWMALGGGGVKERTFPRKIFEVTGF